MKFDDIQKKIFRKVPEYISHIVKQLEFSFLLARTNKSQF